MTESIVISSHPPELIMDRLSMRSGRWVSLWVSPEKCIICLLYTRIEPQQVIFHSRLRTWQILIFSQKDLESMGRVGLAKRTKM